MTAIGAAPKARESRRKAITPWSGGLGWRWLEFTAERGGKNSISPSPLMVDDGDRIGRVGARPPVSLSRARMRDAPRRHPLSFSRHAGASRTKIRGRIFQDSCRLHEFGRLPRKRPRSSRAPLPASRHCGKSASRPTRVTLWDDPEVPCADALIGHRGSFERQGIAREGFIRATFIDCDSPSRPTASSKQPFSPDQVSLDRCAADRHCGHRTASCPLLPGRAE
jgi:hypothetical protein